MAFDDIIRSVMSGGVQPVQAQQRIEGDPSRGVQMIGSKTGNRAQGYYGQLQQPDQQEAVQSFMQMNNMQPTPENMQIAHDYLMGGQWDRGARSAVTGGQIADEAMAADAGATPPPARPDQGTPGGDSGTPVDDISEGGDGGGNGLGKAAAAGAGVGVGATLASRARATNTPGRDGTVAREPSAPQRGPSSAGPDRSRVGGGQLTQSGDVIDAEVVDVNPARTDNALGYTPDDAPIDDPMRVEVGGGGDGAPSTFYNTGNTVDTGDPNIGRRPVMRDSSTNMFSVTLPDGRRFEGRTIPQVGTAVQAALRGAL